MNKVLILITAMLLHLHIQADTWNGSASDKSWYDKTKTEFHIYNAAQLKGLADLVNNDYVSFKDSYIYLEDDIDLNNRPFSAIGRTGSFFEGYFFGNNHCITNLYPSSRFRDDWLSDVAGLFGYIKNSRIESLCIQGSTDFNYNELGGCSTFGAVVGYGHDCCLKSIFVKFDINSDNNRTPIEAVSLVMGRSNGNVIMENILVDGNIDLWKSYYSMPNGANIAGVIAYGEADISSVSSNVHINIDGGNFNFIGGISSSLSDVTIKDAIFTGSINVKAQSNTYTYNSVINAIANGGSVTNVLSVPTAMSNVGANNSYGMMCSNAINCWYLSDMAVRNESGYGVSSDYLKSGSHLPGFITDIWAFEEGKYPKLKALVNTYRIQFPVGNGKIGILTKEGEQATIEITAEIGYELKSFYIDYVDYTQSLTGNRYIFEAVNKNHIVSVIFEQITPNAVSSPKHSQKINLLINSDKSITFENCDGTKIVNVYDVSGKIVLSRQVDSHLRLMLDSGLYIIRVGESTYKVSL